MRKRLLKLISLFMVFTIMTALVVACSSSTSSSEKNGEVTLKVLDWNTTNTKEAQDVIKEAIKTKLPNVNLEFETIKWDSDFSSVMQTRIVARQLPDIILIKGGDHPKYKDHLMDLSSMEFLNQIPKDIRKASQIGGKDYAVPYTANFQGVFYNKKIFADNNIEIPKTWSQLMEVAKTLQSKGITPFTSNFKDSQIGNATNQFATLEVFSKNPEWGNDLQKGDVSFAKSSDYKTVFKHMKDLYKYSNKDPFSVDFTEASELFATGKTAMWIVGTWAPSQVLKNNPDIEIGFFPTPAVDANNTKIIMQPDYTWSASATTNHPEQVKKVLEILATDKSLAKSYIDYVQTESVFPKVVSSVHNPYIEDINTYRERGVINANIGNVQIPWPYQEQYSSYISEWLLGQKTLKEALKATDDYKSKVKFSTK